MQALMKPRYLINGMERDVISATDRGLQYGDGVFTTARVSNGQVLWWDKHMARLARDCARLGFNAPEATLLSEEAERLCGEVAEGVLKILITRGEGERGYRPPVKVHPNRVLRVSAAPAHPAEAAHTGVKTRLCVMRLSHNPPLAGVKHLNRLEQVLARAEWDDQAIAEGVMQDQKGYIVEATQANIFFVRDGILHTPDVSSCGVAGVMREIVMEQACQWGIKVEYGDYMLADLRLADEVFLTNCLIGLWPVRALEDLQWQPGSLCRRLQMALVQDW